MQYWQWMIQFLFSSMALSSPYSGQIIAILEDEYGVDSAGYHLFKKNPQNSQLVKWVPNDNNDPSRGGQFLLVESIINPNGKFEGFRNKKIGIPPRFVPIDDLPHGGRIQVLGHGYVNEATNTVKMGRMDASQLSLALKSLLRDAIHIRGAIKRISLVGCEVGLLTPDEKEFFGDRFPEELLQDMKEIADEVSSRNVIVQVDSSGRKLYGEQTNDGTVWRPEPGTVEKTVISLDDAGNAHRIQEKIAQEIDSQTYTSLGASPENFKPTGGSIELEDTGEAANPRHVKLSNSDLFDVISFVAIDHFRTVSESNSLRLNWDNHVEKERLVRVLDQGVAKDKTIKIREFSNYAELTQEIQHWGEKGFEYPSYDMDTKTWTNTDTTGAPFADEYIYYRYGDFVYSVKVKSDLQVKKSSKELEPFHTTLEGVIVSENPNEGATKNTDLDLNQYTFGHSYALLQPQTDENFFPDARKWMGGEHSEIETDRANAINGETTIAMFTYEAIRDYRVHVTNRLSLDLNAHFPMFDRNAFFRSHPIKHSEDGPAREHGNRIDFYESEKGKPKKNYKVRSTKKLIGSLLQQWVDVGYKDSARRVQKRRAGSASVEARIPLKRQNLIHEFEESLKEVMTSDYNTGSTFIETNRAVAGPLFVGPYDAREVEEPQMESVNNEVNDYREAEDLSPPLQASHAMLRDQLYLSKEIAEAVEAQEAAAGKKYEVNEDSIAVREGKVTYEIYEPSNPSSRQNVETDFDESKMTSKDLMDEMYEQAQSLKQEGEGAAGRINKGLGIYGTVLGIKGTVEAFERGDIWHGTINLAQTLHGLGELSGLNQKIYKAAGKAVGKLASRAIGRVSETIGQVVGEDAGKLIAGEGSKLLSMVGKVGEVFKDIPIVGTAFGIYSIYEDLQQHTVIGYVDAGLDALITVLGLLGPEAEPFVIALTIIRLGIDSFYTDIKKELDSLPPDASTGQEVVAVLKGIGEAILDIADTLTGGIYSAPFKVEKLEKQYQENQQFLRQIADYHNYFKVTVCNGSAPAINFAGAADSWNGGNINFQLLEGGRRGELTMTSTLTNGQVRNHSETIIFEVKVTDIIMGIGESNKINFKKQSVKVFWVIPVDERKIISGLQGDRLTLHGEYYGNSDNNNFFAVQKLPNNLPYGLADYHYIVKGNGGNDSFYFGPQHTYVEGNAGADTYFLDGDSTHVTLNNYDSQETEDFMIIPKRYQNLSFSSSRNDVIMTAGSSFKVTIQSWFSGSAYRHLNFKTSDYVLFHIKRQSNQVIGVPYALSGAGSEYSVWFDPSPLMQDYPKVKQVIGSDHTDFLFGYNNDDVIIPGKGSDYMNGRNGSDTYNIQNEATEFNDEIDNGASDEKLDTIIFPANAQFINASKSPSNIDLIIQSGSYTLTIKKWFLGKTYQHVTLYSQDRIFLEIHHNPHTSEVRLIPILKELTSLDTSINLDSSTILRQVTSVVGTHEDDTIVGNDLDNYMAGGGGYDIIAGKQGADTYVVKVPSPNGRDSSPAPEAHCVIINSANDGKTDLLLFDAYFDNININAAGPNLNITDSSSSKIRVVLFRWFDGTRDQHLLVRSKDGVAFTLPLTSSSTQSPVAVMIDKSKAVQPMTIDLTDAMFQKVKRVIGSPHSDVITGNDMDNYIDPREGGGTIRGNNGSDTYVLKPGYGQITIQNVANDNVADTVLFGANYTQISVTNDTRSVTLRYTDPSDATKSFSATLVDYVVDPKARHLTILSSDGITFIISPEDRFTPVIIIINKASQHSTHMSHQNISLSDNTTHGEVRSVYGYRSVANHITGNEKPNTIVGGDANDVLLGEDGNDILKGGAGNDTLFGGPGKDILSGGSGNDILYGGYGNDILSPGAGDNYIDGGPGDDIIMYAGDPVNETGIYVDLNKGICQHPYGIDEIHNVENVYGTPYNDTMISSFMDDNVLRGKEGNDTLMAYDGYDILIGGNGSDTYNLLEASGTKVVINEANDGLLDTVDLSYINTTKLRFEQETSNLIVRIVSEFFMNNQTDQFPGCHDAVPSFINLYPPVANASFCESYSPLHPTLILRDYFNGTAYQHLTIVTADCSLDYTFLSQQPVQVICN